AERSDGLFHTACFQETSSRRRTEVVIGPVESVDSGHLRRSQGVVGCGWMVSDRWMNCEWLWRVQIYPTSIHRSSSSCSSVSGHLCTLCTDSRTTGGVIEDSTVIPRGSHRRSQPCGQVSPCA